VIGLESRSDINHHIGTVSKVTEERVGVELHGAVWETSGGDAGNEKAVAIRPANLRPCRVPMRRDTCIGCAGDRLLLRLLAGSDHLPDGIPQRIVDYLHIDPVSSVSVVAASSSSEQYELEAVLEAGSSCWWISASGTTPDGQGSEWLEFSFGDRARLPHSSVFGSHHCRRVSPRSSAPSIRLTPCMHPRPAVSQGVPLAALA
jgi:hypothetical protein